MITHNLLPYLVSVIITVVSTAIPEAISAEVGLAYFGLSFDIKYNQITLGQVLTTVVKTNDWMQYPYLLIAPMMVMAPLTICFFYLGLALADPKMLLPLKILPAWQSLTFVNETVPPDV